MTEPATNDQMLVTERFRFTLNVTSLMVLPAYKGGVFRGGFGGTFRRLVCTIRNQDCTNCMLKRNCLYVSLFAPEPPPDFPDAAKFKAAPPPYVLNPPLTHCQAFRPGRTLDFELVLIGSAIEALPYFVYTFIELGKRGIGRERGKYDVARVDVIRDQETIQVYDNHTKTLSDYPDQRDTHSSSPADGVSKASLELLTPLRLKEKGSLVTKLDFALFFQRLVLRVDLLSTFHGNGHPLPDFQPLLTKTGDIRITESNLRWYDWGRYSAKQKTLMKLGGLRGRMTLEGDLDPFVPLLRLGEQVNVGLGTSFGLGRCEIRVPPEVG